MADDDKAAKRVSLKPLSEDEALRGLLETKPPPKDKPPKATRKGKE